MSGQQIKIFPGRISAILAAFAAVSGCGDKGAANSAGQATQQQAKVVAAKISATTASPVALAGMKEGGACNFDSINGQAIDGKSPEPPVYQLTSELGVEGWSAMSTAEAALSAQTVVAVRNDSSGYYFVPQKVPREDVAVYFKNRGLVDTGFIGRLDTSAISGGDYRLEILMQGKDGTVYRCGISKKVKK